MGSVSLLKQRNPNPIKRTIMKTLTIFACLLAVTLAAEKTAEEQKAVQLIELVDQVSEEQRYGGFRGGRRGRSLADETQEVEGQEQRYGGYRRGYGGRRYGRSVADETLELEGQEQRYRGGYGGYRGGYGGRRYGRSVAEETQEIEGQEQRYGDIAE